MSRLPDYFFCWIDGLAFGRPTKYSIVMFQVSELFYNEVVTNLKVIPDLKEFSISVSENFFLSKGLDCFNVYRKIHVIQLFVFLFFFIFRFKVYSNFILAYVLLISAMQYLFLSTEMLEAVRVRIKKIYGPLFQVKGEKIQVKCLKKNQIEIYIN